MTTLDLIRKAKDNISLAVFTDREGTRSAYLGKAEAFLDMAEVQAKADAEALKDAITLADLEFKHVDTLETEGDHERDRTHEQEPTGTVCLPADGERKPFRAFNPSEK